MGQNPLFRGKNGEEMGKFFEVVNQPSGSEPINVIISLNRPTRYYITGKRFFKTEDRFDNKKISDTYGTHRINIC